MESARTYLTSARIGDRAYFGPELEHFVFNEVRYDQSTNYGYYEIDAVEANRKASQSRRFSASCVAVADPSWRLLMIRGLKLDCTITISACNTTSALSSSPPSLGLSRVGDHDRRAIGFRQRPDIPNRSSRGDRQSLRRARVPSRPDRDRGAVPSATDRTMRMARWPMSSRAAAFVRRDMRTNIAKTAIAAEGQAFDLEITPRERSASLRAVGRPRDLSLALWTRSGVTRSTIFPNASYLARRRRQPTRWAMRPSRRFFPAAIRDAIRTSISRKSTQRALNERREL